MKTWLFALLVLPIMGFATSAEEFNTENEVTHFIEEVETPSELKEGFQLDGAWRFEPQGGMDEITKELDRTGVIIDKVVNLGKKIWTVIENGKPAVNVKTTYANGLPLGVSRADQLEKFSPLQFRSIRRYGVNLYGVTVYDVTYTLVHRFGGQYEGRGAYLESVTVLPQHVEVMWGYKLDFFVEKVSAVNIGTRENPVASLALETTLNVSTVLQEMRLKNLHEFRGDSAVVNSTEVK
jgi:hypothetical protein